MSDLAGITESVRCRCGHTGHWHKRKNFGYCTNGDCLCIKFVRQQPPVFTRICMKTGQPHILISMLTVTNTGTKRVELCQNCKIPKPSSPSESAPPTSSTGTIPIPSRSPEDSGTSSFSGVQPQPS